MNNDLISRSDLSNVKPEFLNEKVVRDTKYQTAKDRIYAKAWNACNSCWIDIIDEAPTVCGNNPKWCENCVSKGKCASTRPQAEWKEYKLRNDIVVEYAFKCSNCKKDSGLVYRTDFCPNCGAKMQK